MTFPSSDQVVYVVRRFIGADLGVAELRHQVVVDANGAWLTGLAPRGPRPRIGESIVLRDGCVELGGGDAR